MQATRLLKWMAIATVLLMASVVAIGYALPDSVRVERSAYIDAPPAAVYDVLNGFENFTRWSPWADMDPGMSYRHEGPARGIGAKLSWQSENPSIGGGSQEIIEAQENAFLRMRFIFDGRQSENYTSYLLAAEGAGARVVWAYETQFHGHLLGRYFGLLLDRALGGLHERGLARLKSLIERQGSEAGDADIPQAFTE